MSRELQGLFDIEYLHAADVLEGLGFTATILTNLQKQGIIDYANVRRALVLGYGNGHEMWLLQQLGIPYILGIDDDNMPMWSAFREKIIAKTPGAVEMTGHTFSQWLDRFNGEPFDLMLAIQAPAGFWGGVEWDKVANILTKGGVFIIDSDDDPAYSGFTPKLIMTRSELDFSIDFPAQVNDLTNNTTTIYDARERMGFKRNVSLLRHVS